MAHPLRIQRRREKGWRMPPGAVYVGRPTVFGNPFDTADEYRLVAEAIMKLPGSQPRLVMMGKLIAVSQALCRRIELRGKQLACWCPLDQPCHADVLCEIANRTVGE